MFESKLLKYIDKADHSEKMTPEMIKRIVGGKESLYALSKELGCSYSYLRLIKQGKIYKAQVAEVLKELGLESAEIHSHDTKLPSEHKAPTANTPQSTVDLTAYENPNNILSLLKNTPKYASLDAWSDWLSKHYGAYNGRYSRHFDKPETYVPTEVKVNSKALKDERLTLNLLITYISHSVDDTKQYARFIVKGEFVVVSAKGKPSISQKGKLELKGFSAHNIDAHFKTDAENQNTREQSNENVKANKVLAEHFLRQHEGEYREMVASILKNSPYEIKGFELKHSYEGSYRLDIEFTQGKDYQTGLSPSVKATYEDGKTEELKLEGCFKHEGSFFYGSAVELTRKIKSIALDKAKTLEGLKFHIDRLIEYAVKKNYVTEKANDNLKKELNEAYHHLMSQAHWTTLKFEVKDEGTRFHFYTKCAIENSRLDNLLSKGDYNKLIDSPYDHFYLGVKDGKVQLTSGYNGRAFTEKECLEFLDNIDRLASNNLKKAAKSGEMVEHEANDLKAKIETIFALLAHDKEVKTEVRTYDRASDRKGVAAIVRRVEGLHTGKIWDWSIVVSPALTKPVFEFDDDRSSGYKRKSKEQILAYIKEKIETFAKKGGN